MRERFGVLGGAVLSVTGEPSHQRAWARGADGEEKLARTLERRTEGAGVFLLHDRRVPGSRANIDHLAVGASGVTVIDAKRYTGRIGVERRGGLFTPRREKLVVGRRDRTALVEGVRWQAGVIREILDGEDLAAVPVRAALCFVDGDWPLFGRLSVGDVWILAPRGAAKVCVAPGPVDRLTAERVAAVLAARLMPA